jgi:hypothetical protein
LHLYKNKLTREEREEGEERHEGRAKNGRGWYENERATPVTMSQRPRLRARRSDEVVGHVGFWRGPSVLRRSVEDIEVSVTVLERNARGSGHDQV